ncbi:MAG: hypothetical protein ACLGHQ_02020, partial [Acidimicrobiia bacterium]
ATAVLDALDNLRDAGTTVLVATHDERILPRLDTIVTIRNGSVASIASGGDEWLTIDSSGRLQLPPDVLADFPESLASLRRRADAAVEIRPGRR